MGKAAERRFDASRTAGWCRFVEALRCERSLSIRCMIMKNLHLLLRRETGHE